MGRGEISPMGRGEISVVETRSRGTISERAKPMYHAPLSRSIALALAAIVGVVSTPVQATPPAEPQEDPAVAEQVDELIAEAARRFDAGDNEGAIAAFKAAYRLDPDPNFLYNIGRVFEEAADLKRAIAYYREFAKQPSVGIDLRRQALDRIKVLKAVLDETDGTAPPPPPPPAPSTEPKTEPLSATPAGTEPGDSSESGPNGPEKTKVSATNRKLRIAGYSLMGIGVGVVIGGAISGALAAADSDELSTTDEAGIREQLVERGERRALIADSLFIAGGVIALTGLGLTIAGFARPNRSPARARFIPSVTPRHAALAFRLTF